MVSKLGKLTVEPTGTASTLRRELAVALLDHAVRAARAGDCR